MIEKSNILTVIDLFAGCGGLSEGFKRAGFDTSAQVEMDRWACETLRTRHLYYFLKGLRRGVLYNRYIREEIIKDDLYKKFPEIEKSVSLKVIQATLGDGKTAEILEKIESSMKFHETTRIHVLLGGPPCQPYSLAGRSRDPYRKEKDDRHYLYKQYLEMLERIQPDVFVYENVPGLVTARSNGENMLVNILSDFESLTPIYRITPPFAEICENPGDYILNSVDFCVPQKRRRLILIGYKKSLEDRNPNIRNIFSRLKKISSNSKNGNLTIRDAIGDLPRISPGEGVDGWYCEYGDTSLLTEYQKKMHKSSPGVIHHRARNHMKSDLERYKYFINHINNGGTANLTTLIAERPDLVPAHKHLDKFIDRFKVQRWERPATTITAHIQKDGHYYIHPDISQCRSFTVREAARCQSFPDNFKFEGPRTEQFKQVGNAVPPQLAYTIACVIKKELLRAYNE